MDTNNKKKQKPTYWERVIKGKGTVSEDWLTPKELWKEVKHDVYDLQKTLSKLKSKKQ